MSPSKAKARPRRPDQKPKSVRAAFSVYQKLMRLHGTSVVLGELYQWFVKDRKTLGYEFAGLFNLLSKPEKEAIRVLDHVHARIAGGTEKAGMGWAEFVNSPPPKRAASLKKT